MVREANDIQIMTVVYVIIKKLNYSCAVVGILLTA